MERIPARGVFEMVLARPFVYQPLLFYAQLRGRVTNTSTQGHASFVVTTLLPATAEQVQWPPTADCIRSLTASVTVGGLIIICCDISINYVQSALISDNTIRMLFF
jgi:hypothetical protein